MEPAKTARALARVPLPVTHAAYRVQQATLHYPLRALQGVLRRLARQGGEADTAHIAQAQARYVALLKQEIDNVEAGHYGAELLFQLPMADYARGLPRLLSEMPALFKRYRAGDWRSLPEGVELSRYPAYYRRTFHWQRDGYLSRRSAELYDLGVELVFTGSGDVMRRQVIPPIAQALAGPCRGPACKILDVACGTGRTLLQLARTFPEHDLYGLDLSPYYLQVAREVLAEAPNVSLVAENAEAMPFRDQHFDVVTSTFLFHELPRAARRAVLREMFRVLRPGGTVVIEDSVQRSDAPELAFFLGRFPEELHEPFYADYLQDDLQTVMREVGFEVEGEAPAFMAKVVTGRRPSAET
ncbi:MAG: methyltransferase domain-containing protein [Deltaproteobacteria bacterium]|nr:methyltransferase domain-containing protein [Deltaproteobacteria bacterium]